MAIRLICLCGRGMALPEKYAGEHVRCPKCGAMLSIPTADEDLELTRWFCSCGLRLKARVRSAGHTVRCPRCHAETTVPLIDPHDEFIGESFLLDSDSGIVQLAPAQSAPEPLLTKEPSQQAAGPGPHDEVLQLDVVSDDVPTVREETVPVLAEDAGEAVPAGTSQDGEQPVPSVRPPPIAVAHPARDAGEVWAEEGEEAEGIRTHDLSRYFNAKTGVEAAKTGVMQVLHGYWLYIPYALLGGCMTNVGLLIRAETQGQVLPAVLAALLPGLFSLFLYAGFVGCVMDGVFERHMGIERMLYNGARHFLRFIGTCLLMIPVIGVLLVIGASLVGLLWNMAPGLMKIISVILAAGGGLFFLQVILIPPVISVLEATNPFVALGRGLIFAVKHVWHLITITAVSMFVGGGVVLLVYMLWIIARAMLYFLLPVWLFEAFQQFFWSLLVAALMGQLVASFMLLYLSTMQDEERLRKIRGTLKGPHAEPKRLYLAICLAAVALLALAWHQNERRERHWKQNTEMPAALQTEGAPADRPPAPTTGTPAFPAGN